VTMDDPPLTIFTSKDGRHAKRNWRHFVGAAYLHSDPLDLEDVRQIRRRIVRDALEAGGLALSQLRSRTLHGLLHLRPSAGRRTKGVGEGDVVAPRNQFLIGLGSPVTNAFSAW